MYKRSGVAGIRQSGKTVSSDRIGIRSILARGRLVDQSMKFSPFSSFSSNVSVETPRKSHRSYSPDLTFAEKVRLYVTCLALVIAHMLAYADTYIVMSVVNDIEMFYSINKFQIVIMTTSFYLSYSISSPFFGFLGDRYNRKNIMMVSIIVWSTMNLGSSFVPPDFFIIFLVIRITVGIGQSSFCTLIPSIISDLFVGRKRTRAICAIYLGIPIGGGLGYATSGLVALTTGSWQWSLRITYPFAFICTLILKFVMEEPLRGQADGARSKKSNSPLLSDLLYLVKNKTFAMSTMGFLYLCFSKGALKIWWPEFMQRIILRKDPYSVTEETNYNMGLVACLTGVLGIIITYFIVKETRRYTDIGDPVICSVLMFGASLTTFLYFNWTTYITLSWILYCLTTMAIIIVMTVTIDILMYTVLPNRRSLAVGFHNLIGLLFGDTASPLIVGMVTDLLDPSFKVKKLHHQIKSIQLAMYIPCLVFLCSALSYLISYFFVYTDMQDVLDWAQSVTPSMTSYTMEESRGKATDLPKPPKAKVVPSPEPKNKSKKSVDKASKNAPEKIPKSVPEKEPKKPKTLSQKVSESVLKASKK